eukprot:ANDGO_06280.mRNA.1 putative small nuclear ribonucleoprotein F
MAPQQPVNPKPLLLSLVGQPIIVRLKWGIEYRGLLVSTDAYMNLQLSECEEWVRGHYAGLLGQVLIRCNNVLYIRQGTHQDLHQSKSSQSSNRAGEEQESDAHSAQSGLLPPPQQSPQQLPSSPAEPQQSVSVLALEPLPVSASESAPAPAPAPAPEGEGKGASKMELTQDEAMETHEPVKPAVEKKTRRKRGSEPAPAVAVAPATPVEPETPQQPEAEQSARAEAAEEVVEEPKPKRRRGGRK